MWQIHHFTDLLDSSTPSLHYQQAQNGGSTDYAEQQRPVVSCCELASHMPAVAYAGLLRPCL